MLLRMVNAGDLREFLLAYVSLVDEVAVSKFKQMEAEDFVNAARDHAAAKLEKMESSEYKNRIAAEKHLLENKAYTKGLGALSLANRELASAEVELRGADKVMAFLQAAMNQGDVNVVHLLELLTEDEAMVEESADDPGSNADADIVLETVRQW